jgi:hypothetical protein
MILLQWKKKIERTKAHTLFKVAASIAKLSAQFSNNGDAVDDNGDKDEEECGQQAAEEPVLQDKDEDADKNKQTPWLIVRERTIPTERPPLVGEI